MDSVFRDIVSNYPHFLLAKEGYYRAYSHKIDDDVLDELSELNKLYQYSYKRFTHKTQYDKIYTIGDIHADYTVLVDILVKQDIIIKNNDEYDWNPRLKNTCIIQIGDFIHGYPKKTLIDTYKFFKPDELKIVRLFKHLIETEKNGNKLIVLLGNHEFMNLIQKYGTGKILYASELYELMDKDEEEQEINDFILENCEVCCVINNLLFCHAGITRQMIKLIYGFLKYPKQCYNKLTGYDKFRIINIFCISIVYKIYKALKNNIDKTQIKHICLRVFCSKIKLAKKMKCNLNTIDDYDIKYLLGKDELFDYIKSKCEEDHPFVYTHKITSLRKIDSLFRCDLNDVFAYNSLIKIVPKYHKYIKLMFSSSSSKSAGLLSNYFYSLNKDRYKETIDIFNDLCSELKEIKGMIVGHIPQKNILYSFNETYKKVLINIDNLIAMGQNQCDTVRHISFDGIVTYKTAKILQIVGNIISEIDINIDEYMKYIVYDKTKPSVLSSIVL